MFKLCVIFIIIYMVFVGVILLVSVKFNILKMVVLFLKYIEYISVFFMFGNCVFLNVFIIVLNYVFCLFCLLFCVVILIVVLVILEGILLVFVRYCFVILMFCLISWLLFEWVFSKLYIWLCRWMIFVLFCLFWDKVSLFNKGI